MYNVKYADSGSRSQFYILDNTRGFKEFTEKYQAEYAHDTQNLLSKYNLAPKVLSEIGKIRLPKNLSGTGKNSLSGWGFITEVAETIGCEANECSCGDCDDIYDHMLPKIAKLGSKISDLGYYFCDDHLGNVGYVKRKGRKVLVCIDTGEESIRSEDYDDYDDECSCYYCRQHGGNC